MSTTTFKEKLLREIRIQKEILDSPIADPNRRIFIEGRLEGLEISLALYCLTTGESRTL